MKLSMNVDFRILKRDSNDKFVPMGEDEAKSVGIGGFCFSVGDKQIPFDWTAYSGNWDDRGYYSFVTGYGWMNDFELDECFDEEYEKLGIKREDISAKMLASAQAIDEFYVDFEVECSDGVDECGVGENTDKSSDYRLELLRVAFEDIETGRTYDINPVVLDAFNKGEKLYIRALCEDDGPQVEMLDEMSDFGVESMLDCEDYAYGLFKGDELIGYCTIGCADVLYEDPVVANYPGYCCDSFLLSDVFIKPEEQGQGYAVFMVNEAVKMRTEYEKELVFLTLLDDDLSHLYEKCGFEVIQPGLMVRDERVKTLEAVLADAIQTCEEVNNGSVSKNNFEYIKE